MLKEYKRFYYFMLSVTTATLSRNKFVFRGAGRLNTQSGSRYIKYVTFQRESVGY